ncbi:MAG TPA: serine/threonine-protein kinase [Ktedonobacterales bacterium]
MADLTGRELGGCRLVRPLGSGGGGEVYLAEWPAMGSRLVAVKVAPLGDAGASQAQIAAQASGYQREAALLASFSHPNILPVYASGAQDGYFYLVTAYAPAGSLSDAVHGRSSARLTLPAPLSQVTDIISQVASALHYTHEHGIVHRDVKPGNVLIQVGRDGRWTLLLADYGVAGAPQAPGGPISGTFTYMAPEQFQGRFSPQSDQYSLAVMAYQLLAGRTPFEGDLAAVSRAHAQEAPPSLRGFNPSVPPAVESVISRALAKDPAHRFSSVAIFAQALREAAAKGPLPTMDQPTQPHQPSERGRAAQRPPVWPGPEQPPAPPRNLTTPLIVGILASTVLIVCLVGLGGVALLNLRGTVPTPTTPPRTPPAVLTQTAGAQATSTSAGQATATAGAQATGAANATATESANATATAAAQPTATPSPTATLPPIQITIPAP